MALSSAKSEHAARKHGGVQTASSKQPRGIVQIHAKLEIEWNWSLQPWCHEESICFQHCGFGEHHDKHGKSIFLDFGIVDSFELGYDCPVGVLWPNSSRLCHKASIYLSRLISGSFEPQHDCHMGILQKNLSLV